MTAKEVIRNFEGLPPDEQREVIDWVKANLSRAAASNSEEPMNIQHAVVQELTSPNSQDRR